MWQEHAVYEHVFRMYASGEGIDATPNEYNLPKNGLTQWARIFGAYGSRCSGYDKKDKTIIVFGWTGYARFDTCIRMSKEGNKPVRDGASEASSDVIPPGRYFYGGNRMVSRMLCLNKGFDLSDDIASAQYSFTDANQLKVMCSDKTSGGGISQYCCNQPGVRRYLISYMKIDPRFRNRINNGITIDFYKILGTRKAKENIGIIKPAADGKHYEFRGKIGLRDVYKEEIEAWNADPENHVDGDTSKPLKNIFPPEKKNKTYWLLPEYLYKANFFCDGDPGSGGNSSNKLCTTGCLVRIRDLAE